MEKTGTAIDIGVLLDTSEWTGYQKYLTALAATAVVFDGFDIQILAFAIPLLIQDWGVPRAAFAPVLALGLAGMAVGSPLAGYLGDRLGRRPALMGCVITFALATMATAFISSVAALGVLRFLSGMGAGGALPNASALVAEFAPPRRRAAAVKLTMVCVPLGGMLAGFIAARVLPSLGWRALYGIGGILPIILVFWLWAALPESPRFLVRRSHQWSQLRRLLNRMGHRVPEDSIFEDRTEQSGARRAIIRDLLRGSLARDTTGLWVAFFFCMCAIYLVFGWMPAMLTSQGLDIGFASRALALSNAGGVVGVLLWAALVTWFGSRSPLLLGALGGAASALAMLFIPVHSGTSAALMLAVIAVNGLLLNAVQTAMYALAAHVYPTSVRASGVAFAAAVGRVGAMVSSMIGATVIASGASAYWLTLAMAMVCAFAGLAWVRSHYPAVAKASGRAATARST